jgi:hypothetical protein
MKFMKKLYGQSFQMQFSSTIVSTTEDISSRFSVFRWFGESAKCKKCAKSVKLEKLI